MAGAILTVDNTGFGISIASFVMQHAAAESVECSIRSDDVFIWDARVFDKIVSLLSRPETYPEPTTRVERVETHISVVLLTDQCAYKLKRPVRFSFLDFSSQEARRAACEAEVALNRRLAPDVYLGVVPITRSAEGRLALGGEGAVVDWVVRMRRLPAERSVASLIRSQTLTGEDVDRVARRLVAFYAAAETVTLGAEAYASRFERQIRDNRRDLLGGLARLESASAAEPSGGQTDAASGGAPGDSGGSEADADRTPARGGTIATRQHAPLERLVKRAHTAQLRLLQFCGQLLQSRVYGGWIVDGHGDLRPEHVYLEDEPLVIDCIEFNPELRQIDAADELAFLAVECDRLGADWVGPRVVDRYAEATGDRPLEPVMAFYKTYRACVRAKVAVLRAEQLPASGRGACLAEAEEYLNLASRFAAEFGPAMLLVVTGTSGSGKSTIANAVAESLAMDLLSTDTIRREQFGGGMPDARRDSARGAPPHGEPDQGVYRPEARREVYRQMLRRVEELAGDGVSVVLDGTFQSAALRGETIELARRCGAVPLVVRCRCPIETAKERIASRRGESSNLSDAWPELVERQSAAFEPDQAGWPVLELDTTLAQPRQLALVMSRLAQHVPCWDA